MFYFDKLKKYDIDLKENFLESKSKYDIIILSHVIEHFREPKEILIKIKSMLKENGFIYIEVFISPNKYISLNNSGKVAILGSVDTKKLLAYFFTLEIISK